MKPTINQNRKNNLKFWNKNLVKMILLVFVLGTTSSHAQFGDLLKKAEQKIKGEVKNKVDTSTPNENDLIQPDACINNVKSRAGSIVADYYVKFKENPKAYLAKSGALWFPRKDFEAARYYYTCGKEGYQSGGRACEELAKVDPRYVELKSLMLDAEQKMLEIEKVAGYEFVSCIENVVLFKEVKTGRVLSSHESNKI
jgi:hypothetical protein